MKGLERPSDRDYRSVLRFMEKGGGQLFEEEMSWVYDKEDLVTLRPGREHAWLDGILERVLKVCRCRVTRVRLFPNLQSYRWLNLIIFLVRILHPSNHPLQTSNLGRILTITQETDARTDDAAIHYYDRRRISKCVTFIITIMILILLMVPIWLLYKSSVRGTLTKSADTIILILAFTLIFSAALSAFTKAKRHEIVAASAG